MHVHGRRSIVVCGLIIFLLRYLLIIERGGKSKLTNQIEIHHLEMSDLAQMCKMDWILEWANYFTQKLRNLKTNWKKRFIIKYLQFCEVRNFFVPLSTQGMQALFRYAASERVTQLGWGTGQSVSLWSAQWEERVGRLILLGCLGTEISIHPMSTWKGSNFK